MPARGTGAIRLEDGREVSVLYTNRAIMGVEKTLNRGIIGLLEGFVSGESGIGELAAMLQAGMEAARRDARAGGSPISLNDALDVLDAAGFAAVAAPVMEALAAVIGYEADNGYREGHQDPNW